jgi:hypothetical protein
MSAEQTPEICASCDNAAIVRARVAADEIAMTEDELVARCAEGRSIVTTERCGIKVWFLLFSALDPDALRLKRVEE